MVHPQRFEDALAQVILEWLAGDVLDDLSERCESVVAVGPLGSRLDLNWQALAVVLTQRGCARSPRPNARADTRLQQVPDPPPIANPSGMGQKMAHRWTKALLGRHQPERAKVIAGGHVQVHEPPLAQLHHRDRGERLGDRPDPEHRVIRDRLLGFNVRDAVAKEPLQRSVAHDNDSEPGGGPAVQPLGHLELQIELVDRSRRTVRLPGRTPWLRTLSSRQTLIDLHQTRAPLYTVCGARAGAAAAPPRLAHSAAAKASTFSSHPSSSGPFSPIT